MSLNDWLGAFVLTQVIEVPIYCWMAARLTRTRRAVYAFGASAITHPIIWFCLPWQTGPYVPLVMVAEAFAVVVEALWGRLWRAPLFWKAALLANAASFGTGMAVRWVTTSP